MSLPLHLLYCTFAAHNAKLVVYLLYVCCGDHLFVIFNVGSVLVFMFAFFSLSLLYVFRFFMNVLISNLGKTSRSFLFNFSFLEFLFVLLNMAAV